MSDSTSNFIPKFLSAGDPDVESDPSSVPATEEQIFAYVTRLPESGRALTFYQKELARLLSLGKKPKDIATELKCSLQFVYACMKIPEIIAEAERYRDRIFEGDVADRLKELNADAFKVCEELVRDPTAKINLKWDAAKWLLEKTTGKAIQAVDIQSSTLEAFHKLLTDMSQRGEVLDVTPGASDMEVSATPEESENLGFNAAEWVEDET